ncbi:hypothetical protein IEQ34_008593 [Dendrobium chrysotoxum]|uniref:Uncharacterized protein n=1 Tax=Dendrobium chrysotoxum TaxID=161865 RepID=A0AAV7GZV5_DENCH|nr:hypothetical protein IEQ34_008593 [Dendrobium chrysotoxum]
MPENSKELTALRRPMKQHHSTIFNTAEVLQIKYHSAMFSVCQHHSVNKAITTALPVLQSQEVSLAALDFLFSNTTSVTVVGRTIVSDSGQRKACQGLSDEGPTVMAGQRFSSGSLEAWIHWRWFQGGAKGFFKPHSSSLLPPSSPPIMWRMREYPKVNVMAAVSFKHKFFYVAYGWEGSTVDMRVL